MIKIDSNILTDYLSLTIETLQRFREAEVEIIAAAESLMYEYGRSPEDRHKNIRAKCRLYDAVRDLQRLRGDEDIGGPTPPKEAEEDPTEVGILRQKVQDLKAELKNIGDCGGVGAPGHQGPHQELTIGTKKINTAHPDWALQEAEAKAAGCEDWHVNCGCGDRRS